MFTRVREEHISMLFMNGRIRCVSELLTRIQLVSTERATSPPCVYTQRIRITQVVPLSRVTEKRTRFGGKKKVGERRRARGGRSLSTFVT